MADGKYSLDCRERTEDAGKDVVGVRAEQLDGAHDDDQHDGHHYCVFGYVLPFRRQEYVFKATQTASPGALLRLEYSLQQPWSRNHGLIGGLALTRVMALHYPWEQGKTSGKTGSHGPVTGGCYCL